MNIQNKTVQLAVDKNQFAGSHGDANARLHIKLKSYGIELLPVPLPFGDYVLATDGLLDTVRRRKDKLKKMDFVGDIKVSVDLKAGGLDEVAMNIQSKSHDRFRDECILAQKCGCKLYGLVVDEHVRRVDDVATWKSKRKKSKINSQSLSKAMATMADEYGIRWQFVSEKNTARAVMYLLTGKDLGE